MLGTGKSPLIPLIMRRGGRSRRHMFTTLFEIEILKTVVVGIVEKYHDEHDLGLG